MARRRTTATTRTRQSSRASGGPKVAITRKAEDRRVGAGGQITLDDDEKFLAYALFDPDPAAEDNPGYLEYAEHWDLAGGMYVPCWGLDKGCLFCRANNTPSNRALGVFQMIEPDAGSIKIFRFNWTTLQEWLDTLDEDGATIGKKVRIKCVDKRNGEYTTRFFDEALSKKDLAAALKDGTFPSLQDRVQKQLDRSLEKLRVQDALARLDKDDDDEEDQVEEEDTDEDEDEEEVVTKSTKTTTRRGRVVEEDEDEEETDEDEEDEEEEEADEEEDDEEEEEEAEEEEEEDEEEAEEDEEEEEEEELTSLVDKVLTITSVNEKEASFSVEELEEPVFFEREIYDKLDWDAYSKGDKIVVNATIDDEEDWVVSKLAKRRGRPAKK